MTIHKYPLTERITQLMLPYGAQILTAQTQSGIVCLWALMDPARATQRREIEIVGTGWPMDAAERRYIGTVQQEVFVWHVFERV